MRPDWFEPHQGLADLYQHHLARPADAEREYRRTLDLDATNLAARQGLVFLHLTDRPDLARAQAEYQLCLQQGPEALGTRLCRSAIALWTTGWDDAQPVLATTLASPAGAEIDNWRGEFRLIIRQVRALGRLADLAALLRNAAGPQPAIGPWAEAVGALAAGAAPPAGATPAAARLYEFLTAGA